MYRGQSPYIPVSLERVFFHSHHELGASQEVGKEDHSIPRRGAFRSLFQGLASKSRQRSQAVCTLIAFHHAILSVHSK
jgi:hypothetical protein